MCLVYKRADKLNEHFEDSEESARRPVCCFTILVSVASDEWVGGFGCVLSPSS